mmetsp:Transcript_135591/g.301802  ORF Transcript_135591/g.301802 Transcript_135591/m.301802 type:complete len:167 (+) Transcript_135591:69-569(+)
MAEEEGSWDQTLEEWVLSEGYNYAAFMAQCTDGAAYAAAPVAEEAGWGFVYKEDHEEEIEQDDGSKKKTTINEPTALLEAIAKGKCKDGFWVGGLKYNITQFDAKFESGDAEYVVLFANRPKKGINIVSTGSQIVAGLYDEEKGQTAGNSKKTVLAYAEYLKSIGY